MREIKTLPSDEATQKITELIQNLQDAENLPNENLIKFRVEKFVNDVLDYCHREDFPETLIYSAVDLLNKNFADESAGSDTGITAPISEIKQDDVSFKFAVNNVNSAGVASDSDFDSIKPKLNLYRKVVSL